MFVAGIDLGSSFTKAVILDAHGSLLASHCQRTGTSFENAGKASMEACLKGASLPWDNLGFIVSTGVGRKNSVFSQLQKSEISCLARGGWHLSKACSTIVDIGSQDNKVVFLTEQGKVDHFQMNRKCAAGTGAFIQEIAMHLDMDIQSMNSLAGNTQKSVEIGSYCTVFAGTEIIHHIRNGKNVEEILRGVYASVVHRILEMGIGPGAVLLCGGLVEKNPVLVELFREKLQTAVVLPEAPQLAGAIGAAIYGLDKLGAKGFGK
jgi:(R)-2-hydroxyacyl-CoA dehydratese activating ATPase